MVNHVEYYRTFDTAFLLSFLLQSLQHLSVIYGLKSVLLQRFTLQVDVTEICQEVRQKLWVIYEFLMDLFGQKERETILPAGREVWRLGFIKFTSKYFTEFDCESMEDSKAKGRTEVLAQETGKMKLSLVVFCSTLLVIHYLNKGLCNVYNFRSWGYYHN